MAPKANTKAVQDLINLPPGIKGTQILVKTQGLERTAFSLAFMLNDFSESLKGVHLNKNKRVGFYARANWEARSNRRGGEKGVRPHRRATGQMSTFGDVIKGVNIIDDKNGVSGFGFPNVPFADNATVPKYLWRTWEFGLRPHKEAKRGSTFQRGGMKLSVEAPDGKHLMPLRFSFSGGDPSTSRLIPLAKTAGESVTFVRLFGKKRGVAKRKKVVPGGLPPMFFVSDAIVQIAAEMPAAYRQVLAKSYGRR